MPLHSLGQNVLFFMVSFKKFFVGSLNCIKMNINYDNCLYVLLPHTLRTLRACFLVVNLKVCDFTQQNSLFR